jgi:peptidyl-prolyl cis-trans isomerase B (cyclophilin B)
VSKSKKLSATAQERLESFQAKQELEQQKATRRSSDNKKALLAVAGAIVLAVGAQFIYFTVGPGSLEAAPEEIVEAEPEAEQTTKPVPPLELAENRGWEGTMEISGSALEISLDGENAPQAVANFISLVREGYFEGTTCHRLVVEGIYVLQCGDPTGTGQGGPGYNWGPIENAPADNIYETGLLAMARVSNDGESMGSQFFIVYDRSEIPADAAGGYTVFGKVTAGLEGLQPIIEAGVLGGGDQGQPALEAKLGSIELR